ncbi:beta-lactamase family protein [Aestuariibacter sp. AA17]|uniref:Beta-lactamase family protein n=1 Tax=Fluctibacter corallii TaxID=2984329 RepID=A0ABT3A4N0_9ALTE|nr:serine hydrolase [Aestuariibacter sp. AA17]MCV2883635.1 beta-lactamase family protein [Aestuariibacter sp. AA17]
MIIAKRRASIASMIFIVILMLVIALYWQSVSRLWIAVTLYDEDKIVDNFVTLYHTFESNRIPPADTPFTFPVARKPMPEFVPFQESELNISSFLKESGTTGLLLIQDGEIRVEEYFQGHEESKLHISWSMGKSFVSALIGIAIDEGYIKSIEQQITDYVPELVGSAYDGVTIKHALQMSSGVRFNEDYGDFHSDINRFSRIIAFGNSLDEFTASLERERQPGTYNHYVSIDTQALGMVLDRAISPKRLTDYLQEKLWHPLGMEYPAYWLKDKYDMELALGGLHVALRDYGKFGWLYLNKGSWQGQQLVPAEWIAESITPDGQHTLPGVNAYSSNREGYGYQWWLPEGAEDEFLARGIYHQFIYIDPDKRIVIVKNSANHRFTQRGHNWNAKHMALFRGLVQHFSH